MLRQIHALPGLIAAVLVAFLALTGAVLSLNPAMERAGATVPKAGEISVAALAGAVTANHREVDRIVKTASGSVIVYYFNSDRDAADLVDPATGVTTAPYAPSDVMRVVTNLHRSLLMGDAGRATAGIGALAMVVLAISGAMMLAARLGGWRAILRPVMGSRSQRLHSELGRFAVLGLMLSALTACYLSLATFGILPDGTAVEPSAAVAVDGGARMPVGQLAALKAVDLTNLRELTFPKPADLNDVYVLTTAQGIGQVDAATGALIAYQPHSVSRQIYETIYMLHTGQGLWPLALILGLAALCVPALSAFGVLIWWKRRRALPRIAHNVGAQSADTIILVGSEGNSTWGFASTLHAALTKAGHRVHTAPMNRLAPVYAHAARMLILTATYGDGAAPASANRFLVRLDTVKNPLPVAVLGFGDRSFPHFCRFAEDVASALRDRGWPALAKLACIDRQSAQDFARWGADLGAAIGTELTLTHIAARPKNHRAGVDRTCRLWRRGSGSDRYPAFCRADGGRACKPVAAPARATSAGIRAGRSGRHSAARQRSAALLFTGIEQPRRRAGDLRAQTSGRSVLEFLARTRTRRPDRGLHSQKSRVSAGARQDAVDPDRGRHRHRAAGRLHPAQHWPAPRASLLGRARSCIGFSLSKRDGKLSRRPPADASQGRLLTHRRRRLCAGSDRVGRQ